MATAQRPTWLPTAAFRPVIGVVLATLVACRAPAGTTRGPAEDALTERVALAAPVAFAPPATFVPQQAHDAAVALLATSGDDILERAPSPATAAWECVTPGTCAAR